MQAPPQSTEIKYTPTPVGQLFHRDQSLIRVMLGGNRSGKTHSGGWEVVNVANGTHPFIKYPVPNETIASCLNYRMGEKIMKPKLEEWLDIYAPGWKYRGAPYRSYTLPNGSEIYFMSAEAGRDAYQGIAVACAWLDEHHPEEIYQECLRGLMDEGGKMILTMTPFGLTWEHSKFWEHRGDPTAYRKPLRNGEFLPEVPVYWNNPDESFSIFRPSVFHNYNPNTEKLNLPPDSVEQIIREWEGTKYARARLYGEFVSLDGLVYEDFTDKNVVEPFPVPKDWKVYETIDWGWRAAVCLWIALSPSQEIYVIQELVMHHTVTDEFVDKIKASRKWPIHATLADLHNPQDILMARNRGINCLPATKTKNKTDECGKLQNLIYNGEGGPQLFVFSHCERTLQEFRTYKWKRKLRTEDNTPYDVPEDKNDDCMDAIRQAVISSGIVRFPKMATREAEVKLIDWQEAEKRLFWRDMKKKDKRRSRILKQERGGYYGSFDGML